MSIIINLKEAQDLLEMFGGEDAEITITMRGDKHPALFAHYTSYPEEGELMLGTFRRKERARRNK